MKTAHLRDAAEVFFGLLDHVVTIEQMRIAFDDDGQRPLVGKCFAVKRGRSFASNPVFSIDAVIASGWSAADGHWAADIYHRHQRKREAVSRGCC